MKKLITLVLFLLTTVGVGFTQCIGTATFGSTVTMCKLTVSYDFVASGNNTLGTILGGNFDAVQYNIVDTAKIATKYWASNNVLPVSTILPFAGTTAPAGYLLCDGSAISRTTYVGLFSVISTTYGPGDGSTTFNLPDLRQRFPLGKATSGTGSILGNTGGNIDHLHTVDPPNTTSTTSPDINNVTLLAIGSASAPSHTHDVNISQFSSGTANPPYLVLNYIIKI